MLDTLFDAGEIFFEPISEKKQKRGNVEDKQLRYRIFNSSISFKYFFVQKQSLMKKNWQSNHNWHYSSVKSMKSIQKISFTFVDHPNILFTILEDCLNMSILIKFCKILFDGINFLIYYHLLKVESWQEKGWKQSIPWHKKGLRSISFSLKDNNNEKFNSHLNLHSIVLNKTLSRTEVLVSILFQIVNDQNFSLKFNIAVT